MRNVFLRPWGEREKDFIKGMKNADGRRPYRGGNQLPKITKFMIRALLGVVVLAMASGAAWADDSKTPADDKVAVINGTVINKARFELEIRRVLGELERRGQVLEEAQKAQMKKDVLENLIDHEILYQETKKSGVKVDPKVLEERMAGLKAKFRTPEDFQKALEQLEVTEEGLTEQVERGVAIQQLIEEKVVKAIKVEDAELKTFYDKNPQSFMRPETVRASHILVAVAEDADAEQKLQARKKLEGIKQRLDKGEDFAKLAEAESSCPSKAKGGDLGFFPRGQMVPAFEAAAFSMQPGQISDIVETRFGYHLIKVTERKPAEKVLFDEVKEDMRENFRREKIQKEVSLYVQKLKEKAKVERFLAEES